MKKVSVIFMVLVVFMLVSFANGQDCGKCPMKQKCTTVKKQQTVQKEEVSDPVVYMNKIDKIYHQKDCKTVKGQQGYTEVVLSKALEAGAKPCTICNPPVKPALAKEITKEKKQVE
jgi:hypothetical protein